MRQVTVLGSRGAFPEPGRLRISPRVVKRAMSRYSPKGKADRTTYKATITIAVLADDVTPDGELN